MKLTHGEAKTTLDTQGTAEGAKRAPHARLNVLIPLVVVTLVSSALLAYRVIYNVGPRQEVTIGFDYANQGQFTMPISVRVVGCSSTRVRVDERYYLGLEGGSIQLPEGSFEVMTYAGSVLDDGSLVYAKKAVPLTVGNGVGEEDEETAVEKKLSGEARDVLADETNAEQTQTSTQTQSTTGTSASEGQEATTSTEGSESDQAAATEEGTDGATDAATEAVQADDSSSGEERDGEDVAQDAEGETASSEDGSGEAADEVLAEVDEEGVDEAYVSRVAAETIAAESAPLQTREAASEQAADEAALEDEPKADVVLKLVRRSYGTVRDEGLDLVVSAIEEGGVNEGYDAATVEESMRQANDVQLVEGNRWDPLGFKLTLPPYWRGKVAGVGDNQSSLVTIGQNYGYELLSTTSFVVEAPRVEEPEEEAEEDVSEQSAEEASDALDEDRVRVGGEDEGTADAEDATAQDDAATQDETTPEEEVEEEPAPEVVWEPTGIPEVDAEPWAIYRTARGIKVEFITVDGVTAARMNLLLDSEGYDGYLVIYLTDYQDEESYGDNYAYLADLQRLGRDGRTPEVALCSVLDFLTRDRVEFVDGKLVEVVPESVVEEPAA